MAGIMDYFSVALPVLAFFLFAGTSFAQLPVSLFGTSTPATGDGGDPQPAVLGVRVFSDVPGQILGCSFYKAPANLGVHVVSLWDATGVLLATRSATGETASGKQLVIFPTPVAVSANQIVTCGYFAPAGHFANDRDSFTSQKSVSPLHVPANGGVFSYGAEPGHWPNNTWAASNYWVDVLFVPSNESPTWIHGIEASASNDAAKITWSTAVPSDSQVEYGASTAYGNFSSLSTAIVSAPEVTVGGLMAGAIYHYRLRSRDPDGVLVVGADRTLVTALNVTADPSPPQVSVSPTSLSFNGQAGGLTPAAASLTVTSAGPGPLVFTVNSDQPWLLLSAATGTAPFTLWIAPSIGGLEAGTYTGHVKLSAGGVSNVVTVALVIKPAAIQHSVALYWTPSKNSHVVSYSMYRSNLAGSSYALWASAIGGLSFIDQGLQSGTNYYYVVTAVDDQGQESSFSNEIKAAIP
jgi:hypothetical protein